MIYGVFRVDSKRISQLCLFVKTKKRCVIGWQPPKLRYDFFRLTIESNRLRCAFRPDARRTMGKDRWPAFAIWQGVRHCPAAVSSVFGIRYSVFGFQRATLPLNTEHWLLITDHRTSPNTRLFLCSRFAFVERGSRAIWHFLHSRPTNGGLLFCLCSSPLATGILIFRWDYIRWR